MPLAVWIHATDCLDKIPTTPKQKTANMDRLSDWIIKWNEIFIQSDYQARQWTWNTVLACSKWRVFKECGEICDMYMRRKKSHAVLKAGWQHEKKRRKTWRLQYGDPGPSHRAQEEVRSEVSPFSESFLKQSAPDFMHVKITAFF